MANMAASLTPSQTEKLTSLCAANTRQLLFAWLKASMEQVSALGEPPELTAAQREKLFSLCGAPKRQLLFACLEPIMLQIDGGGEVGPTSTTIISVTGASSTELQVIWTPGAIDWGYMTMEVYEDAGLTILNQTISQAVLIGATSLFIESLDPATQYWIRMKVRLDSGPYSDWSNTGTGTTDA